MSAKKNDNLLKVAEVDLVYKTKVKAIDRPTVKSSIDAAKILKEYWDLDKIEFVEQFKILLLNRGRKVLGVFDVCTGGVSHVQVDVKVIFMMALKMNAASLILAHNHPSGTLAASLADIDLTKKIVDGGNILTINVDDHIIITNESYYSFADNGQMKFPLI
ncbi:JAB domain-containing protein [Sphingobacterium yanglingense]|uniref:DNA repair protein RadC n=1 Tax=Sphingobacterium yanglingense TaxID=1437280 RepID=A0A4R6WAE3_9SPHI|nr:JAB domain-containing protein [Sphingobacterium yanglingense]TDQ73845.1 DNA repair protein RadC [Sphingobacterium yanglingense]